MSSNLLKLFEKSLKSIDSITSIKNSDTEYSLSSPTKSYSLFLKIIKCNEETRDFKFKISMLLDYVADKEIHAQIEEIIKFGFNSLEDSPCKLTRITNLNDTIQVQCELIFTDYSGIFMEKTRPESVKESDFKLIILSMVSELYMCLIAINGYIEKTVAAAIEAVRNGAKNEEKQ